MKKSLTVNCGNVVILSDRENTLENYASILFNCGNVYVADSINAKLATLDVTYNCGNTTIVEAPKNPVEVKGLATISGDEYAGLFPVCEKALVTPAGVPHLASLEGMIVMGKLYYPEGAGSIPASIRAGGKVPYPADAKPIIGDAWLRPQDGGAWMPDTKYFIAGTAYALDAEYVNKLANQGTSFVCGNIFLYEGMEPLLGKTFKGEKVTLIPDGYAFAKDGAPLMDLYATCGKKVYVLNDLTVQPRDARHITRFESILVRKTAQLPLEHFDALESVIRAEKVELFEGELLNINGFQTLSHDMLKIANEQGIKYTIKVNGFLLIEDDVTDEDMRAIAAIKINGAISAPGVTHMRLNQAASKVNGAILPSISELKKMVQDSPENLTKTLGGMAPGPIAKMLGIDPDEGSASTINCGNYVLI